MKAAGLNARELRDAGYPAGAVLKLQFSHEELRTGGYTAAELRQAAGLTANDLRLAGYLIDDLREAQFTVSELRHAGFGAFDFRTSVDGPLGPAVTDLAVSGFSAATWTLASPRAGL